MIEQKSEITLARLSRLQCHCRIKGHLVEHENIWGGRKTEPKACLFYFFSIWFYLFDISGLFLSVSPTQERKSLQFLNGIELTEWFWQQHPDNNLKLQRRKRQRRWVYPATRQRSQDESLLDLKYWTLTGGFFFFCLFIFWEGGIKIDAHQTADLTISCRRHGGRN